MSDLAGGDKQPRQGRARLRHRLEWVVAGVGAVAAIAAAVTSPDNAQSAAAQNWSPFVLVSGLLLIGLVAHDDGIFAAAGHRLARASRHGIILFIGAAVLIGATTAVLNLDTSVAFLTPVNLTNLIVLGHLHVTGGQFFGHMRLPALVALIVTALVIAVVERRAIRVRGDAQVAADSPAIGLGILAIGLATLFVVVLRSPAVPVLGVGVPAVTVRILQGRENPRHAVEVLGVPVLVGLLGLAVALGTLGRIWSGPASLLGHLDPWGTAGLAALSTVLVNNLPAASLLAARPPVHPFSLLIGLNLGPNLFATGSLAWFLWLRAAQDAGAQPSVRTASRIGVVAVPLALVAAIGVLLLSGAN